MATVSADNFSEYLQGQYHQLLLTVASLALLVYDYCLTVDQEVREPLICTYASTG